MNRVSQWIGAALLGASAAASAADWPAVSPQEILFRPSQQSASVTLTNPGTRAMKVELVAYRLKADGGAQRAQEITLVPRAFTLKPGKSQDVIVKRPALAPQRPTHDIAYRLEVRGASASATARHIPVRLLAHGAPAAQSDAAAAQP